MKSRVLEIAKMARDLNNLMRQYYKSANRYQSRLDFICNKYTEQNEDEEACVVDLSSMHVLGEESGYKEIAQHLRKLKSSKEQVSPEALKRNGSKKFENQDADSDQFMSGGEEEDSRQFNVLKDMSHCMDKFYDSQESEPSDAETLSSVSSDSDESYSDYNSSDSGEDTASFDEDTCSTEDDNAVRMQYPGQIPVEMVGKKKNQVSEPLRSETYIVDSRKQLPYTYSEGRTSDRTGTPGSRKPTSQLPYTYIEGRKSDRTGTPNNRTPTSQQNRTEKRRSGYTADPDTGTPRTHRRPPDFHVDSSDSERNLREPNNNTLKSNLNYISQERLSRKFEENSHQVVIEMQKESYMNKQRRKSGFSDVDMNQLENPASRKYERGPSEKNLYPQNVLETEAQYNDSMLVRPGSQFSNNLQSYQSSTSSGSQQRNSRGQWEITGSKDFIKDLEDEGETGLIYHGKRSKESCFDSPRTLKHSELYKDRQNLKLSNKKRASPQNDGDNVLARQQFDARNRNYDVNASPLKSNNNFNNGKDRQEVKRKASGQKQIRNLSESPMSSPLPHEATFDKCSKKDSGIGSFMEDSRGSEVALKVLSVKNLKTFNESFSEKSAINVSMNQSDIEQLAETENKEKVKKWLHSTTPEKVLVEDSDDTADGQKTGEWSGHHGDGDRTRSPRQQVSHKRHGSGLSEKADTGCQTMSNSPRYIHSPRHDVRWSASAPDLGNKEKEKRTIKKVNRSLNAQGDSKRSKDIGAMMRNVYGSPAKLRLMGESLKAAPNNAVKRLAEDLDYEAELSDEYSAVGHMPTPPKSRKINQATRRQVPSLSNSPVKTSSDLYRGQVLHGDFVDTSCDRMMSINSNDSYIHSSERYQRRGHINDQNVAISSGSRSHHDRNRSNKDSKRRQSFEHYERQSGTDGSKDYSFPENIYSSIANEDTPHRDYLVRASSGGPFIDRMMAKGDGQSSKIPKPRFRVYKPLGSMSADIAEVDHERQANGHKQTMVQNYVQNFERNSKQVFESPTGQSKSDIDHHGRVTGPHSHHSPEPELVYADEVSPRQLSRFEQVDARIQNEQYMDIPDSGNVKKSQSKDMRRKSREYTPQRQNVIYENFHSPGMDSDTPVKHRQTYDTEEKRREKRALIHRDNLYKYSEQICDEQSPSCQPGKQQVQSPFNRDTETHRQSVDTAYQLKEFLRRERNIQQGYDETDEPDGSYKQSQGSRRARHEKKLAQIGFEESDGISPGIQSPHYQRNKSRYDIDNAFSPSGSMAKLRLSTPKGKDQFSDRRMPRGDREDMAESAGIVYSNVQEDPMSGLSESYGDTSRDSRRFSRHNSGESYRNGRYVENLSDKENDFMEKDRTGFISLDEICSVSGPLNVQRYSRSPRENMDKMRNTKVSENLSNKKRGDGSYEEFSKVDRVSPRYLQDEVEGHHNRRETRSPRETTTAYTLSGPTRIRVDNSTDTTMDSLTSSGSRKSRNVSQPHSRSTSMSDKHSSINEREQMVPNTSGKLLERSSRDNKRRSTNQSFTVMSGAEPMSHSSVYSTVSKGGYEASLDTIEYTEDERDRNERGKPRSNRIREDMLVRAEHQSPDYNIAHVRKMDLVKQPSSKPKIKKSLFVSNRNVETPVNFKEFAQGISNSGVSEPIANKQTSPKQIASLGDGFKVPFSVNGLQNVVKKAGMRNLPPSTKPFQQNGMYGDVMSSTLREASRKHLSELRNRAGNIVHSTPMGSRAPLMLNETISTILAPEETDHEEVILI